MTNNVPILRQISIHTHPSAYRLLEYPQRRTISFIAPAIRSKAPSAAIVVNSAVHTLRPAQALAISRVVSLRALVTTHTSNPTTVSKGSSGSTSVSMSDRFHTNRDQIRFSNQQQNSKRSLFNDMVVYAAAIVLAKTLYENWQRLHPNSSPFDRTDLIDSNGESEDESLSDTLDSVLGAFDPEKLAANAAGLAASAPEEVERAKRKLMRMLTPEAVTRILRANEKSVVFAEDLQENNDDAFGVGSVWRYDINSVASNNPIEDDHSEHVVKSTGSGRDQLLFGVFDGHSGWNCSQKVARELGVYATKSLEKLVGPEATNNMNAEPDHITKVAEALQTAFMELDAEIVEHSVERLLKSADSNRSQATQSLLPALAGSCALLAYVDRDDLYVACAGDSRAVLGTWDEKAGKWSAVPMSVDQTGKNEREMERLKKEHPGEEESVVMKGRVLGGLEPTRAFGDARYKWSQEVQSKIFDSYFPGRRSLPRNFMSPPYVTAKPEVNHRKLSRNDRFLVMATDGLWDKLTNDEVVALVGGYLDALEKGQADANTAGSSDAAPESDQTSSPAPINTPHSPALTPRSRREFTFQDSNVSTHLIRNALGGASDEKLCAMMSIPPPMCRAFRDDITVTVVFFGGAEGDLVGPGGVGETKKSTDVKKGEEAKKEERSRV